MKSLLTESIYIYSYIKHEIINLITNFKESKMKYASILALLAVAQAATVSQRYTYEDIREQELKCKADRNREWKYDAATNTWACPLQRYD